jgi:UDP-N-acetylglucosamine 2-epimerase
MCLLLDDPQTYRRMSEVARPFGDGKASVRIADRLADEFSAAAD